MPSRIESRVLLCEGLGDEAFLRKLIQARGLDQFEVRCPKPPDGDREGFGRLLSGVRVGSPSCTAFAVLTDADYDPVKSFREVRAALKRDCASFRIPDRPGVFVPQEHDSLVGIFLIPGQETPGSLDSLCLAAMRATWPDQSRCLDEFMRCTGVTDWDRGKVDKSALRCLLAATCEEDPNTGLPYAWSRKRELIPLSHASFDPVVDLLSRFDALCAEAVATR
ncbi:MAG: hypothetical protein FJW40_13210 [Acidobacteria bacterium]|nr:hypothetical protein [Acidobacteriota bacterium]